MKRIALIETGLANTASVRAAMGRLGVSLDSARNGDDVADADGVILPGVGSFGAAMEAIERQGLSQSLRTRIESRLPTLTICLGLQVLARESEETPGVAGLGVLDTRVERFSDSLVTPTGVESGSANRRRRVEGEGYAYYANSHCIREVPPG